MLALLIALWAASAVKADDDLGGAIVYMMDWKYEDIAKECAFLGNHGFAAVVTSPPTENVVLPNRPWHERYEVVSYQLTTRSGNKHSLSKMIRACYRQNVRVLVDIVLNNMAVSKRDEVIGTAGSKAFPKQYEYPDFTKKRSHFNEYCEVLVFQDQKQVKDCELINLSDLKQSHHEVRDKQVQLMDELMDIGVAGFLVDKAKFMWPMDLAAEHLRLHDVAWTDEPTRPIVLYNVEDPGTSEAVRWNDYNTMGRVTDYTYGRTAARYFQNKENFMEVLKKASGKNAFSWFIPSEDALVFLTNVYSYTIEDAHNLLMYDDKPELYKLASAFMLAFGHGLPLILSSYKMSKPYKEAGPPANKQGDLLSPGVQCQGGWHCEHRLPELSKMAFFHLECRGQSIRNPYEGSSKGQFAFARGTKGFVAFNLESSTWSQSFSTSLPEGDYCEVITGGLKKYGGKSCAKQATRIKVDSTGTFLMEVPPMSVRAIHTWNMIGYRPSPGEGPHRPMLEPRGLLGMLMDMFSFSGFHGQSDIVPTAAPPKRE